MAHKTANKTKKITSKDVKALVLEYRKALGASIGSRRGIASRDETARHLECSPGTIYNWERGTVPGKKAYNALVEALALVGRTTSAPVEHMIVTGQSLEKIAAKAKKFGAADRPHLEAEARQLAAMATAIASCSSQASARQAFERAMAALS